MRDRTAWVSFFYDRFLLHVRVNTACSLCIYIIVEQRVAASNDTSMRRVGNQRACVDRGARYPSVDDDCLATNQHRDNINPRALLKRYDVRGDHAPH